MGGAGDSGREGWVMVGGAGDVESEGWVMVGWAGDGEREGWCAPSHCSSLHLLREDLGTSSANSSKSRCMSAVACLFEYCFPCCHPSSPLPPLFFSIATL